MIRRAPIFAACLAIASPAAAQVAYSPPDLSALASAAQVSALQASIPAVTDLGTFTVATLPTCNTAAGKKTAWASDLFGQAPGDRVVCDGVGHWKPVRPLAVSTAVTGDMTLSTLLSAPTQILTGTIGVGVTRNVTLSTTNAYQGAKFCVARKATGLGALLSNTLSLALNSWACWEFDGTAWVQTMSGGLL